MSQRPTDHAQRVGRLLLGCLLCTLPAACTDVTTEDPGSVSLSLLLAGEGDSLWGAERLRVEVRGSSPETEPRTEIFDVEDPAGTVGTLGGLPCSTSGESTEVSVVVQAEAGDPAEPLVLARGVSLPRSVACGEDADLSLLVAPVDEFSYTESHRSGGRADMRHARFGHTTTLLKDGRVLIAGGVELTANGDVSCDNILQSMEIYDPATGTWEELDEQLKQRRAFHTATRLHGWGSVLFLGGVSCVNGEVVSVVTGEVLRPWRLGESDAQGSVAVPMRRPRANHSATLHPEGWVLVAGGENHAEGGAVQVLDDMEMFFVTPKPHLVAARACKGDPPVWTFCRTDSMRMAQPRARHGAAVVSGFIYLFGGTDGEASLDSVERFLLPTGDDPALPGAPETVPAMHQARQDTAWVALNDYVFVFGGRQVAADGSSEALGGIEWYDPTDHSWHLGQYNVGARANATANLLAPGGWVLVAGGADDAGDTVSTALLIEVAREGAGGTDMMGLHGEPRPVGTLRTSRYGAGAVLMSSDRVLVTGGATASQDAGTATLGSAELYTVHPEQLQARSVE